MKIASAVLCFVIALASARNLESLTPLVEPIIPKDILDSKIVGGEEATAHKWPGQVLLYTYDGAKWYLCGGTLIHEKWVLTAAHCVDGRVFAYVIVGAHNLDEYESSRQWISVTEDRIIKHEYWNRYNLANDIALIDLPESPVINAYVQTIPIYEGPEDSLVNKVLTAVGWGKLSDSLDSSPVLMQVDIPVVSVDVCGDFYYGLETTGLLCVATAGKKGTCQGDSGGSLNYWDEAKGIYVVAGITSFGSSNGCEAEDPSGFANVAYYASWIQGKISTSAGL